MTLHRTLARIFFEWSTKLVAFGVVSGILFFLGALLLIPVIGLLITAYSLQWAFSTPIGLKLRHYLAELFKKFYPLPPGNYVHPTEDYGMRLGVNLRKLNESRAKLSDTAKENDGTQSKSVGHYISDSPLHFGPMSPSHSPSRGSTVEVASDDELFDDEESMTSAHRSRSLTLPSSSPISRRRPATDASKTVNRIGVSTQHDPAMESFTRLTSEPILISNGFSKHHLHSSGHTPFPLTDGALAEFAALSSTPQSSSSLIM